MTQGANFIDGRWVPAVSGRTFTRRNPADHRCGRHLPGVRARRYRAAVDALEKAAPAWADDLCGASCGDSGIAAAHLESRPTN